jgi:tRNA-2-methylthio-N6-dimethylallyladenosine synthase
VLVEGTSARSTADLTGHTPCNKVVNFPGADNDQGGLVKVIVEEAMTHSLKGRLVNRLAAK